MGTQYASKFGKLSSGHRTGKGQFSFQPQRKAMPKNAQTTALISHASKEIEENNRLGKTKDLLKKMRGTKGTFHAKMGSIKDRSCMNLIEAEDIKMRWQEYTEELYKKDFHDPDNHDGVITHLERHPGM